MIIDLSVPINEKTPAYPGDPEVKIVPAGVLAKDGYQDHYVSIGTHAGTHMDAPSHMIENGKNLDEFPLEKFFGRGVLIETSQVFDLAEIKKFSIEEGDVVLFHTGMSEKYHEPAYYDNYPAMPEEVAQYLVEKKVKMIGVDACSPDYAPYHAHGILLKNDILIIENLTNLLALEGKELKIYAFPIKLQIDGAPVRVVAEIL
jgi:arylformamidase